MATPERSARVSTLELFFDLVFVFTITQLTGVLAAGADARSAAQVAIVFALVWWMYDGYAWLTNAISTDRIRHRLVLLGGMAGFLVIALAIPRAWEDEGLTLGLAYLGVVVLHSAMYMRGASVAEAEGMLRLAKYNLATVALVLAGGAVGDTTQWVCWLLACAVWLTPWFSRIEDFVISTSHFVERHGLVVIVALGESIVVIGVGAAELELDGALVVVALLALALSASLWWAYFTDEAAIERGLEEAPPRRRPFLALVGFGYWHYGLLLGIVALAAGLKKAVGHAWDPLETWIAIELGAGVALFLVCEAGFRRTLGITGSTARLLAAAAALATIAIGAESSATAQIAALAVVVAAALSADALRVGERGEEKAGVGSADAAHSSAQQSK